MGGAYGPAEKEKNSKKGQRQAGIRKQDTFAAPRWDARGDGSL